MRAAILSFSLPGGRLAKKAADFLRDYQEDGEILLCALPKYAGILGQTAVTETLSDWCRARWADCDLLIFVGASGIAVRLIAPYVKDKTTDPAVLVMDEGGHFVISLLSGHLGGANVWARLLAKGLAAEAVITTATDVEGKFAVDTWAQENRLFITSMKRAKEVSTAILNGDPVGFFCDGKVEGELPEGLVRAENADDWFREQENRLLVAVTPYRRIPALISGQERILHLVPRCISLGLGCRRGKEAAEIAAFVEESLKEARIERESLCCAASIDLKKDEAGIRKFCESRGVPYRTYSAEELRAAPGSFASSSFVQSVTGVDNVCERAAVLAAGPGGRLVVRKKAENGVTVAAGCREWGVRF